jgi:hypothetical protein
VRLSDVFALSPDHAGDADERAVRRLGGARRPNFGRGWSPTSAGGSSGLVYRAGLNHDRLLDVVEDALAGDSRMALNLLTRQRRRWRQTAPVAGGGHRTVRASAS